MKSNGKSRLIGELLVVMLLLGGTVVDAGSDLFSVNFYAPGRTSRGGEQNIVDWQETLTLEADQAAGVGDWETTGWENIYVSWDLSTPVDPVTITSNQGSTATFTFNSVRNGSPYHWTELRATLLDDGNGDLMDGHANATEHDGKLFDMTMSDIPFGIYDVVIYLGATEVQYGDGTGKIVFNGGPEQDFTLKAGEFDGIFTKIVDVTTPANYILFEGVTGSSFTVQAWGNGFNHIGPCGFQIRPVLPVGYWKLDETSGAIAEDSSGNGHDGVLSADPDPAPLWTTDPERGNALEFVSGLDYVDCGPGVCAAQDLTVALWIKPANVDLMRPISCFDSEGYSENTSWHLMLRHDNWAGTDGDWNSGDLWIDECWAPDEWVHMAFTFDEDTDTLSGYINGELAGVAIVPEGRSVASETNPLIMGHGGGVEEYQGLMDDIYIYDVALTEAAIWNLIYSN